MPSEREQLLVKQLLDSAEANIRQAKSILFSSELAEKAQSIASTDDDTVEGVFNGESMTGSGNRVYPVPANYASKSKLVAGDLLKLSILSDGTFLYKQIGPVKRKKLIGKLTKTSDGKFIVNANGTEYQVLPASVTYFKAKSGDNLTILVPEDIITEWAAVENLLEQVK